MNEFVAWVMVFLTHFAAPGRPQYLPEARETREEAMIRYESIARDLATAVFDEDERVLTEGDQARLRMAAIVLSVIHHESGFRKDIDLGAGKVARGDGGSSWCLMQVRVGSGKTAPWNRVHHRFASPADPASELDPQWTGPELVKDRVKCLKTGLRLIVGSACKGRYPSDWLRKYTSGSCSKGVLASQQRMNLATYWYERNQPKFTDADVLDSLRLEVDEESDFDEEVEQ